MFILETERLTLQHLSPDADAEFVLRLLNEPSFLQYIGDKKVRTLDDARAYMRNGPMKSYKENGFGLFRVGLKENGSAIGICDARCMNNRLRMKHAVASSATMTTHRRIRGVAM